MAQLLPEAHLPLPSDVEPEIPSFGVPLPTASRTYSFCGENTRVTERLNLGYRGVNSLDQACLFHDLGYLQSSDKKVRKQLDWGLLQAATAIASNPSNPVYERSHAAVLANSLTAKIYSQ